MIIYLITNKVNNKKYVGQTRSTLKKRFSQHCEKRNKTVVGLAIQKYGKHNFDVKVIKGDLTHQKEVNNLEIEYIKKYNSIAPNGYNIERGGNNCPMSESIKQEIRNKLIGRQVTWGGKTSDSMKKLWENEEYRKKQIKQRHQKRGEYRKGIVRLKKRKNIDIEEFTKDYVSYMHLNDIADKYKISICTIYRIIKREKLEKRGYKCNQKKV
jgi:group I intron endonuclease